VTNKIHQTPLAQSISQGKLPDEPVAEVELSENTLGLPTAREGSTLYYATHRLADDTRQRLLAQLQLNKTLAEVLTGVREPPVAQTKLQWWSEELTRLHDSQARHPDAKRCMPWLAHSNAAQELLTAILDAATAARFDAPELDDDWEAVITRDYHARLKLIFTALTGKPAPDLEALATALGWVDILRQLPTRVHHDQLSFPPSWLTDANIDNAALHRSIRVHGRKVPDSAHEDPVRVLIDRAIAKGLQEIERAIASDACRTLNDHPDTRIIPAWLRMRHAQLRVWQKSQPNLMRETITLTPLKKWWLAFRYTR
jgi:phytoene/squalene synthetase